jgi:DNA polymerase III delta subunit
VADRDSARALDALTDFFQWGFQYAADSKVERGSQAVGIAVLGRMHRLLRQLWAVKILIDRGLNFNQVATELGEARFPERFRSRFQYAQRLTRKEIHRRMRLMLETDRALKRSGITPEAGLTRVVAEMVE